MSASIASAFPSPNVLYDTASGATTANVQNRLLQNQEATQKIGATDMEMVGRAAGTLLNMNEADAAAAYPGIIQGLQQQGFAKNAPATYPGHAAVQGMVQSSIPIGQQYQYGILTAPGVTDAIKAASAPLTFGNTGTGGAGAGGGGGSFMDALASIESGDKNIVSGTDKDSKGLTLAQGGNPAEISQGNFQINTPTWRDFAKQGGVDVNQYPNAMSAPRAVQAQVASVIPFNRFGPRTQTLMRSRFGPLDTSQTVGALAGTPALTFNPNTAGPRVGGTATVAAPPPNPNAGPRVGLTPPGMALPPPQAPLANTGNQFSGPGAPTSGVIPPSPAGSAGDVQDIISGMVGAGAKAPGTDVAGPGAGPGLPDVPAPNQMYQTGLPGITISGPARNALAPPPVAAQAAPSPPVVTAAAPPAPPTAATPPVAGQPPATGQNSPQFRAAMELNRRAQALDMVVDPTGRTKALAASLRAQAALYMQADSVVPATQDGLMGQRSQLTGQFTPYAPRRMTTLQDGRVINDQGQTVGYAAPYKVDMDPNTHQPMYVPQYPTPPNLSAIPGAPTAGGMTGAVPVPGTTPDLGFAEEQKTEATRLSALRQSILDQAKESGSASTMIANTEQAMAEAQKGNIGPAALAPELLDAVATAKSLGMNLNSFGIDPTKLGAAQVTREQLQQLNGAILRKMYPQRITNADLAVSGQALPNYGLDPAALTSNFAIYKNQNAYDTTKAQDMLAYEKQNGTLKGWEQQWYAKNGFAAGPLDNLFNDAKSGALVGGGSGGSGSSTPQNGAPPASTLTPGKVTHYDNGQSWTVRNGQPVRVK